MSKKLIQGKNLHYWEDRANRFLSHEVSWWDINMKKIEIDNIVPYLKTMDLVLDVGCSNGASTVDIYNKVKCKIHGVDYSRKAILQTNKIKNNDLSFEFGNIVNYSSDILYDKVFSIRTFINIMSRADQKKAFINVYKLLKKGGLFIVSEAFYGSLINLNEARRFFKLKPLVEPKYNNYLREKEFEKFISNYFSIIEINRFSSLYYIGTRLFQYLALDSNPTGTDTKLHRFFREHNHETKNSGDFGPQKIYILKK